MLKNCYYKRCCMQCFLWGFFCNMTSCVNCSTCWNCYGSWCMVCISDIFSGFNKSGFNIKYQSIHRLSYHVNNSKFHFMLSNETGLHLLASSLNCDGAWAQYVVCFQCQVQSQSIRKGGNISEQVQRLREALPNRSETWHHF